MSNPFVSESTSTKSFQSSAKDSAVDAKIRLRAKRDHYRRTTNLPNLSDEEVDRQIYLKEHPQQPAQITSDTKPKRYNQELINAEHEQQVTNVVNTNRSLRSVGYSDLSDKQAEQHPEAVAQNLRTAKNDIAAKAGTAMIFIPGMLWLRGASLPAYYTVNTGLTALSAKDWYDNGANFWNVTGTFGGAGELANAFRTNVVPAIGNRVRLAFYNNVMPGSYYQSYAGSKFNELKGFGKDLFSGKQLEVSPKWIEKMSDPKWWGEFKYDTPEDAKIAAAIRDEAYKRYMGIKHEPYYFVDNADGTVSYNLNNIDPKHVQTFINAVNKQSQATGKTTMVASDAIGTAGGNVKASITPKEGYNEITLEDEWDVLPFKDANRFKKLVSERLLKPFTNTIVHDDGYRQLVWKPWIPDRFKNFELGLLIGSKPFLNRTVVKDFNNASLAARNSSDTYYWNGPYEGGWDNFDIPRYKADMSAGKKEFIDWVNNPEYIKAAEFNKTEAQNMGLQYTPIYEKPEYTEAIGKGFSPVLKHTLNGNAVGQVYLPGDPPGRIYLASDMDKSATEVIRHELAHSSRMAYPTSGNIRKELEYLRFKNSQVFDDSKSDLTDLVGCDFYNFGSKGFAHEAVANARDLGAKYGIKVGQEYPGDLLVLDLLKTMHDNQRPGSFCAKFIEAFRTDKEHLKYVWKALNGTQWSILPFVIGGTALGLTQNKQ